MSTPDDVSKGLYMDFRLQKFIYQCKYMVIPLT